MWQARGYLIWNGLVDIKLKLLILTCISLLTEYLLNASKIYLEKAEKSYCMLLMWIYQINCEINRSYSENFWESSWEFFQTTGGQWWDI